ncbi:GRN [Bugula neritina]|uniref:GRN n=1 Tax=Bugula neritina TaxID=10212 RepID=A0A7J7IUW8_BUGNE|nr:GRN [Bugula neritina]
MLSTKYLVLIAVLVAAALGLGHDLKTLLSKYNANCDVNQLTCKSSLGVQCCTDPLGVCCEDGLSCCPQDFSCDEKTNTCKSKYGETKRLPTSFPQSALSKNHLESTNSSCTTKQCNGGETCCHDDWDCCPFPKAVCCKDKGHCCPHGYICDDQPFICRWPDDGHVVKSEALQKQPQLSNVECNATFECPMKNTCCVLPDGDWGCCPIDSAICCSDHIHCCPEGTTCDIVHSRCVANSGLSVLPMMVKKQASKRIRQPVKDNACDATHSCNVDYTCCKMESGEWGCCPTPNAVCCEDHLHCCPDGWVCQSGSGELSKLKLFNVTPLITVLQETHVVASSGQWGCCPVLNAVCCSDHVHCCPSGYTCSTGTGQCIKGSSTIPWLKKSPQLSRLSKLKMFNVTHSYCPSGNTCCRLHLVNGDVASSKCSVLQ